MKAILTIVFITLIISSFTYAQAPKERIDFELTHSFPSLKSTLNKLGKNKELTKIFIKEWNLSNSLSLRINMKLVGFDKNIKGLGFYSKDNGLSNFFRYREKNTISNLDSFHTKKYSEITAVLGVEHLKLNGPNAEQIRIWNFCYNQNEIIHVLRLKMTFARSENQMDVIKNIKIWTAKTSFKK